MISAWLLREWIKLSDPHIRLLYNTSPNVSRRPHTASYILWPSFHSIHMCSLIVRRVFPLLLICPQEGCVRPGWRCATRPLPRFVTRSLSWHWKSPSLLEETTQIDTCTIVISALSDAQQNYEQGYVGVLFFCNSPCQLKLIKRALKARPKVILI